MEKEGARVFHAPLDVGDRQMRSRGEATVLDGYLRGQGDVMILAMNSEDPMNTYLALTRQRQLTGETVRQENRLREPRTFQNLPMHAAITFICVPALHIDHDPATNFAGGNVQPKHPLLYLKRSMDGVQHGTQGEVDLARGAIEIERDSFSS
jgi:hypothetical protein